MRDEDHKLAGLLASGLFAQAHQELRWDHPEQLRDLVTSLSLVFGDCGPLPDSPMAMIVDAAAGFAFEALEKLNQPQLGSVQ